jgi:Protein of unknown function (DUF2281)
MIESTTLKKLEALPESLQIEVLHYIECLHNKYAQNLPSLPPETVKEDIDKSHGYGSWAGQIIMSDDFDEPLEDLKDYL